jgi:carboxyl-terminal processing protease
MKNFLILALSLCLTFSGFGQSNQLDPHLEKMGSLLQMVNNFYVDTPGMEKLVEDAIVGLLEDLDPHSVYISIDEVKKMNEPLVGEFEGVGIQFNLHDDTILVISPISGGPSERLGILSGDKIITIDGDTVAGVGFTNSDVQKTLRGKKGTKVNVGIKRNGLDDLLSFDIIRDKIPIFSVDAGFMINDEVGLIKINRFAQKTVQEFNEHLLNLKHQGMESLILDLRGNSGGYLSTAIKLADEFLEKDRLIVYTQGRSFPKKEDRATIRGNFEKGKLIVLIDAGSASASEIVSGAIQDWDRGLIIGRRSFGKGLVQKPYWLPDQSAVRLTISRYYTPSGRSIQRPYGKGTDAYYDDISSRFKDEVFDAESIDFPDSLKFKTMKGRTVYGGGGIMPDIYVPADTSERTDCFVDLLRKGVFNSYSLDYLDGKRQELSITYKDVDQFKAEFDMEPVVEEFLAVAADKGVERDENQLAISKDLITNLLRAYIARGVWDNSAFYDVTADKDPVVQRAVRAMEDKSFREYKLSYR